MRRAIIEGIVGGLTIAFMLSVGKLDLQSALVTEAIVKERSTKIAAEQRDPGARPCP